MPGCRRRCSPRDRVLTIWISEFSRRLHKNAREGTDYRAAAPAFLAGNQIKVNLIDNLLSLTDLHNRDVKFHAAIPRQVYATVLDQ